MAAAATGPAGILAHVSLAYIHAAVLDWYAEHGRDLAFRRTRDPWAILVSEVIAQQTQAARAAEAWTRFMARFPTPEALAAAPPATAIRAWRGLGYNRRAVALREAAIRIVEEHGGRVPESLEPLGDLPGVGPYTTRAVLAFAFGRPVAPLDTNVRRVLDRALGPLPTVVTALQSAADGFVPAAAPAAWSHALMDIGATMCVARSPRCDACPMRAWCRTATAARSSSEQSKADPSARSRRGTPRGMPSHRVSPRFASTTRWLRGRILDRLRDAPEAAWTEIAGPIGEHPAKSVRAALVALASEGLIERDGSAAGRVRLLS